MKKYIKYWLTIEGVKKILEVFHNDNLDIRFIGGCVRDSILGIKGKDIDFAIACHPNITAKTLEKNKIQILDYGKRYGTITAIFEKNKFEITSLREDINTRGRDTDVIFTNDWKNDARRRDFTFNAINVDPEGEIEDFFDGIKDLKNHTIRFIGNVEERINQDYLRILRYFRFLGIFKNPIRFEEYNNLLFNNFNNLRTHISNDQIRNELLKMLKNKYRINSFIQESEKTTNYMINNIKKWWIEDKYNLGLNKCMNEVEKLTKI